MLTRFRWYTDISIALFAYIFRLHDIAILAAGILGSTFSFGRVWCNWVSPSAKMLIFIHACHKTRRTFWHDAVQICNLQPSSWQQRHKWWNLQEFSLSVNIWNDVHIFFPTTSYSINMNEEFRSGTSKILNRIK